MTRQTLIRIIKIPLHFTAMIGKITAESSFEKLSCFPTINVDAIRTSAVWEF
jgi:hypothetical protein